MLRCFLTAFAVCLAFCARAEESTEEINVVGRAFPNAMTPVC